MQQTIWIVRHGNREDFQNPGWSRSAERPHDPSLSPDGEEQARELGISLRSQPIDRIFASPYLRTIQTASHIADALDMNVYLEPGIGECLPHVAETPVIISPEERSQRFARLAADHTPCYQPAFPEPEDVAHRRAADTVQQLADRYSHENLLFVTHASPIVGIVRHLTGTQDKIRVPLCGLFTLTRRSSEDDWQLEQVADVSHLSNQDVSLRYAHVG